MRITYRFWYGIRPSRCGTPPIGKGRGRCGGYPALLDLFSDAKLPRTYDAWLERAERIEYQFQKAGFGVSKTWIRPIPFAAWCDERNISPDQVARLIFVNEAVRDLIESRQH